VRRKSTAKRDNRLGLPGLSQLLLFIPNVATPLPGTAIPARLAVDRHGAVQDISAAVTLGDNGGGTTAVRAAPGLNVAAGGKELIHCV
jgi:hypothetical protein